jgi:tight adherence protein C
MSPTDALPGPDSLLAWLVGVLTFLSVVGFWSTFAASRPSVARARAIARRRLELEASRQGAARPRRARRPAGLVQATARRLRLLQASQIEKTREKLLRAGLRSHEVLGLFAVAKLVCPIAAAVVGITVVQVLDFGHLPAPLRPLALAGIVLAGFFGPDVYVANRTTKRGRRLEKALPDGLDLLVICAEAGLSLDTALNRVADEMAHASPDLADELAITGVELTFLPERRLALLNLAKRVPLAAMRGMVGTLVQTEKYGTPLAQSLRVLSAELREQRMLRAEEKAARLPATLTVPMIVFILPTLFIVLIGPALIDVYDRFAR